MATPARQPFTSPVLQLSYEHATAPAATSNDNDNSQVDSSSSLSACEVSAFESMLAAQGEKPGVRDFFVTKYEQEAAKNWDRFYRRNADRFYRDRHYLTTEFVELRETLDADRLARGEALPSPDESAIEEDDAGGFDDAPPTTASAASPPAPLQPICEPTAVAGSSQRRLLEVGCGVGNALFPLLRLHPDVFFYGVDCSRNAIQVVQNHADYASSQRCAAWANDLVNEELPLILREDHLDFATLIFVLSAIHPDQMLRVLEKVRRAMKQDGVLFIRDYAEYDLAQLRFASSSKLGSSWYVRQDGTRSYFFTLPELCALLVAAGFEVLAASCVKKRVVNRKAQAEMSRRFVQVRARPKKEISNDDATAAPSD